MCYLPPILTCWLGYYSEGLERFTNVFVKNLPETTTEDELRTMFGEHGEVNK